MIETIMIVALLLLLPVLGVSLYFNYKHGVLLINIIDQIESAIEVLDEKEISISEVLQVPLFYDSPQIRQVHKDIADCRDTVLQIALSLGHVETEEEMTE